MLKENRETGKIFAACALGAFVGSMVALEVIRPLWWLGLLAGAAVGYLSYEWRKVLGAVPAAWQAAEGWKPDPAAWRARGEGGLAILVSIFWATTLIFGGLWLGSAVCGGMMEFLEPSKSAPLSALPAAMLIFFAGAIGGASTLYFIALTIAYPNNSEVTKIFRNTQRRFAPHRVLFLYLPRGLVWTVRHTPNALRRTGRFLRRFGRELFVRIHSDERLLCSVDAAIGAVVGYFAGSAVIGALTGGVFGVLNYEVVSRRILRLHVRG